MLKIEIPSTLPLPPGTIITWKITGEDHSTAAAGNFYPGGAWTDYSNPLSSAPTGRTVYWRSTDFDDTQKTFFIDAFNGSTSLIRPFEFHTRVIDYVATNASIYHSDVDMLQRAMIQVFYLRKGQLNFYTIGQYWKNSDGYYGYSGRGPKKYSPVAEEVKNFQQFTLHHDGKYGRPLPNYKVDAGFLQALWAEFNLIALAGSFEAITSIDTNYNNWINTAVTNGPLTLPADFEILTGKSTADLLKALVKQESGHQDRRYPNGLHSWQVTTPLAYNSVDIGQVNIPKTNPTHTYTDAGLGFVHVQPYNRGGFNLYNYADNLTCGAHTLDGWITTAPITQGPIVQVWFACYAYNNGNYPPAGMTPTQLRNGSDDQKGEAAYADAIFYNMGVPKPS